MPTYKVKSEGKEYEVVVTETATGGAIVTVEGESYDVEPVLAAPRPTVAAPSATATVAPAPATAAPRPAAGGAGSVVAPIPGVVMKILVAEGDTVTAGQTVLVLEAMKMENNIAAPSAGTVSAISVSVGDQVSDGQPMLAIN